MGEASSEHCKHDHDSDSPVDAPLAVLADSQAVVEVPIDDCDASSTKCVNGALSNVDGKDDLANQTPESPSDTMDEAYSEEGKQDHIVGSIAETSAPESLVFVEESVEHSAIESPKDAPVLLQADLLPDLASLARTSSLDGSKPELHEFEGILDPELSKISPASALDTTYE